MSSRRGGTAGVSTLQEAKEWRRSLGWIDCFSSILERRAVNLRRKARRARARFSN